MKHPKRQYIGVALERDHVLPYNPIMPRHRRLNMVAEKIDQKELQSLIVLGETEKEKMTAQRIRRIEKRKKKQQIQILKPGNMYRESNWEIGRAAEKAKIVVPVFKPRDRWTAWQKTVKRKLTNAEKRAGRTKKPKNKVKAKK